MKRPKYKFVLALLDVVLVNMAFMVALNLQSHRGGSLFPVGEHFASTEALFFLAYSFVVALIFQHNNLYKLNVFLTVADHSARIIKSLIYAVLGLAVLSFFTKSPLIVESRLAILYFTGVAFVLFALVRVVAFRSLFLLFVSMPRYRRPMLILGAGRTGKLLAANVRLNNPYGLQVVGFLDDEIIKGTPIFSGLEVLGKVSDVTYLVDDQEISEILICLDDVPHDRLLSVLDLCTSTRAEVKVASPLYDIIAERVFTERYGEIPVVGMTRSQSIAQEWAKRLFDFVAAIIGIVILLPVFILIALAVKLDSRGPVFYKQVRVGKDGRRFSLFKFRSMKPGSDTDPKRINAAVSFIKASDGNGSASKIVNEARITRVGRFLRKTSLDELPQLINVVRGEMSLVGPRPCLPYEWDHYDEWHKKRMTVTPGCTGVWQVSARNQVGFDDMVVLDLYYIQNSSLLMDVQLILKTIPVMLFAKGGK